MKRQGDHWPDSASSERLSIASRIAAAAFGGYAIATLLSILVSRVLPMARAPSVATAVMLSFAFYAVAVLWVFAARTATRAWLGLLVPATVSAALCLFVGGVP
jgi:hypothetical protein